MEGRQQMFLHFWEGTALGFYVLTFWCELLLTQTIIQNLGEGQLQLEWETGDSCSPGNLQKRYKIPFPV